MKRTTIVLFLAAILLLVSATAAFAAQGDSGYIGTGGENPHQGYDTTTKKCAVCHAVHHADVPGSEALLRSTKDGACTYCHISTPAISYKRVYGEKEIYYTATSTKGHNSDDGASCRGCHQVHGAAANMTGVYYLDQKILKVITTGTLSGDLEVAPTSADSSDTAVSKWCSSCHAYYTQAKNKASHVMTSTGPVGYVASTECKSCHNSSTVDGVATSTPFPHYADGARFLTSADTSISGSVGATGAIDGTDDGVCLRCHLSTSTIGVGRSF
jgi:hypothetical protein